MTKTAVRQRQSKEKRQRSRTKRQRGQLIARARKLRGKKMTYGEIAAELGVGRSTVATWFPGKSIRDPEDAISGEVLVGWIDAHGQIDAVEALRIEGTVLTENQQRGLYRWRHEGTNPRLETVEEALISWGVHFCDFEDWAEHKGLCIWARGKAPAWWHDDSNSRLLDDLDSCDLRWRREAREEGAALGILTRDGRRRKTAAAPIAA